VTTVAEPSDAPARRRSARGTRFGGQDPGESIRLPIRVRLEDGRVFTGRLPARKHRAVQLGLLHADSTGLVELTPGTRPPEGKVDIDRRKHACHYLPGGAGARSGKWLELLLEHAARIVAGDYAYRRFDDGPREEAFVGVVPRTRPQGSKHAVDHTRFLWVDVDKPGELPALWELLAERPCHLLVESAGSGGMHAYWRLAEPLASVTINPDSGERVEWVKRANLRLIYRIGTGPDGRPSIADEMCAEQARVMRLAGTINYKTGRYSRLVQVDLSLAPYSVAELVGDLADPPGATASSRRHPAKRRNGPEDPYRRIPPPEYFAKLAGVTVPRSGYVLCPSSRHTEKTASCRVWPEPAGGWWCFGCRAGGAIYDLASLALGGPTGQALVGETFKAARQLVVEMFGGDQ
jgi:hypothetical protein